MNAQNAARAFRAAADALDCGDSDSALEYATVGVAEIRDRERLKLGSALLFLTADAAVCVKAGCIDIDAGVMSVEQPLAEDVASAKALLRRIEYDRRALRAEAQSGEVA